MTRCCAVNQHQTFREVLNNKHRLKIYILWRLREKKLIGSHCCAVSFIFIFLLSTTSVDNEWKASTHEYFIKATPHWWWLCNQIMIPFAPERCWRRDSLRRFIFSDPTDNMILRGNWYRGSNICIKRFNSLKREKNILVWLLKRGLMCYQKREGRKNCVKSVPTSLFLSFAVWSGKACLHFR